MLDTNLINCTNRIRHDYNGSWINQAAATARLITYYRTTFASYCMLFPHLYVPYILSGVQIPRIRSELSSDSLTLTSV